MRDARSHGLWEITAPASAVLTSLQEEIAADVVVIGAGYTGLSTALHLSKLGASVAVVEAMDIGFGGSGRNVGLVNAGLWVMPDVVVETLGEEFGGRLLSLLGEAPRLVFDLIDEHAIQCEAVQAGTLHCGVRASGFAELERRANQWVARGAPVKLLDSAQTAKRVGSEAFTGALFDPRAGTIQPLAYVRGLARAAMECGTRIFIDSAALSVEQTSDRCIVRTPQGSVRAEWIVVATDAYSVGPWQALRAEQVHLPYFNFATAPLEPRLRESILPGREGAWDTRQVLSSFRFDAAGRLIFGSIGALAGAGARIHEAWAKRAVRRIFPQLGDVTFEAGWFGQIGMTQDNMPRLHRLGRNVIGFSGYNGRGIAPGTAFGRVLAALIGGTLSEEELPLPVSPLCEPAHRALKEAFYAIGSQAVHLAGARY